MNKAQRVACNNRCHNMIDQLVCYELLMADNDDRSLDGSDELENQAPTRPFTPDTPPIIKQVDSIKANLEAVRRRLELDDYFKECALKVRQTQLDRDTYNKHPCTCGYCRFCADL